MLIDTHAHLYLDAFDPDRDAVIGRARVAGVEAVLLPAIDAVSVHAALALAERYPGVCHPMAGIHPSYVKDATEEDFAAVAALAERPEIVAIGESGLDYYWDRSFDRQQHEALRWHARLAIERDLPLVLHNRDQRGSEACSRDLVALLREEREAHPEGARLRGVFHCFGGPAWLAEESLVLGFYLGVGGTITYKNAGVAEALEGVPLDRILLETDAPYLAPAPHRGERNEPAHVRLVAERLAEARGLPLAEVVRQTAANARALFGLAEASRQAGV
jgi:TatD DNase family protein